MLVCYLDDSGKDPQNPIITVAGYVAKEDQWRDFEAAVEPWFTEFGVNVLHAKDLHHTLNEFEGWRVLKKQAFVARICQAVTPNLLMGVSVSADKAVFEARRAESDWKRTRTSYTLCFNAIIDGILRSVALGRMAHTEGLAFILECGHEHNAEAEQQFYEYRKLHKLENVLRSISFVPKENCRAIQIADLMAFYSRRHGVANLREDFHAEPEAIMNLIAKSVPLLGFVATDVLYQGPLS